MTLVAAHMVVVAVALLVQPVEMNVDDSIYKIGHGMSDCTGPVAEVNMMGYANPSQSSGGIHLRLHSRAFIIANADGSEPVVFVSVDAAMISQLVKHQVIATLKQKFGDRYTDSNVLLSGTHTHSGPGAYHQYVLFEVTSRGFYRPSLDALVTGIVKSIEKAHTSMKPGNIFINEGQLDNANINRSPPAYNNNPAEERAKYTHNTDHDMLVLRMEGTDGTPLGMINWYAVHPTSMNNSNSLISSDNKGMASILFEADMNPGFQPGQGDFVAAFASSNLGDVSPNIKGAFCADTGLPCDGLTSTCNGKVEMCRGVGPGKDMFESTYIIGHRQYLKAKELYEGARMKLHGTVDHRMKYMDMTNVEVHLPDGTTGRTCKPAMGFSFAAGTTDGPGAFNFKQGDTSGNLFWNMVRNVIKTPSKELVSCHSPKPILLPTGEITFPYAWQPDIVDFQLLRIGQLVIAGVPGEFTTMAGRRTRAAVTKTLIDNGFPSNTQSVIAGLANSYADYIVTYEEYQIQRYEGASTIYGGHTLGAMIQTLNELAVAMAKGESVDKGTPPPNLLDKQLSFVIGVIFDKAPSGKKFGGIIQDVLPEYMQGETAEVTFASGNPRNTNQLEHTFLTVEQKQPDGKWSVVYTDAGWETKFHWVRTSTLKGTSHAIVKWDIPENQEPGQYRIGHSGHRKRLIWGIKAYSGYSSTFTVTAVTNDTRRHISRRNNVL